MQNMTVFLLGAIAVGLIVMMLRQGLTRKVDLFSLRNLYLFGFIIYHIIGPGTAILTDTYNLFNITAPLSTGRELLLLVSVYLVVFLTSYHRIGLARRIALKFSSSPRQAGDSFFFGLALFLVVVAIALRFLGPRIPAIASISIQISIIIAAVASAMAGWAWGGRKTNPLAIALMILIVGGCLSVGMYGMVSRRPMASVLLGLAWGAYHRMVRLINPAKLIFSLLPIFMFVVFALAAFTAIRYQKGTSLEDVQGTVKSMRSAQIDTGVKDLLGGQQVGVAMMWIIENYPQPIKPKMLFSLRYIADWYVPRAFWPEKPEPLSQDVATLAKLEGVNRKKITIPPGVIGYAVAEGGWIAIFVYAIFYGQFIKFFDELIRLNPLNPFIILPVGCATGQVLALARGDIAVYTNLMIVGFMLTYLFLWVVNKMFGRPLQLGHAGIWPQQS